MNSENPAGAAGWRSDRPCSTSFHGGLPDRSKRVCTHVAGVSRLSKIAESMGGWSPVDGQAAIFLGGLAIGDGIVLLKRASPGAGRAGIIDCLRGRVRGPRDLGQLPREEPQRGCDEAARD